MLREPRLAPEITTELGEKATSTDVVHLGGKPTVITGLHDLVARGRWLDSLFGVAPRQRT